MGVRIDHIFDRVKLHYGDMVDSSNLASIMAAVKPDEIYNLAAQSHVKVSFEEPEYTAQTDGIGTLRILEASTRRLVSTRHRHRSSTVRCRRSHRKRPRLSTHDPLTL